MTTPNASDARAAAKADLHDLPIAARLAEMERRVREQPASAEHRWPLFQLLCVTEQWARALVQLQVHAQLAPQDAQAAQAYRDLIRAERLRAEVVAGRARPGFVFDAPRWADDLLEALRAASIGRRDEADRVRERALDQAPLVAGRAPHSAFDWIADSDSRFGPVCEIVTAGHYRWLPFSDIAAWHVPRPARLIDLVWAPCAVTLVDGGAVRGFMPARYPAADDANQANQANQANETNDAHETNAHADRGAADAAREIDALRVGHRTTWREAGRTGVIARGRKTWSTSAGDYGLFELERCAFGAAARAAGAADGATHDAAHGAPREGDGDGRA
ncbi:type VI secretion system accessory protein TagJ [Burkholderia sp. MSMB1498]|uniref:type VI secretion system accessory protein TagJ n=1 Tax=Burkholderia sp. MSMB1498 TaxID=1637842 RepID=UPI0007589ED7|nr:type VI secretion system accessory protein TagJ [Burkholderia sp. MSMB1498]KVK76464.1 ImpE/SciE family protein [Burkholderia sp. MSMB1498]